MCWSNRDLSNSTYNWTFKWKTNHPYNQVMWLGLRLGLHREKADSRIFMAPDLHFWVWQLFFSVLAGWIWVTWKHYHDALGQIAEDSRLQFKVLSADDGVGHVELEEEWLEHFEDFTWSQTKTLRGQTESLCLPSGDGVWDLVLHVHSSRLSELESTHKQTKDKFRLWFAWGFSEI